MNERMAVYNGLKHCEKLLYHMMNLVARKIFIPQRTTDLKQSSRALYDNSDTQAIAFMVWSITFIYCLILYEIINVYLCSCLFE